MIYSRVVQFLIRTGLIWFFKWLPRVTVYGPGNHYDIDPIIVTKPYTIIAGIGNPTLYTYEPSAFGITVAADRVILSGFTIKGAFNGGIWIYSNVRGVLIKNLDIIGNDPTAPRVWVSTHRGCLEMEVLDDEMDL
jgi:hypothetical protein